MTVISIYREEHQHYFSNSGFHSTACIAGY